VLVQAMGVVASSPMVSALLAAGSAASVGGAGKAAMESNWITSAFTAGSGIQTDANDNPSPNGIGDWTSMSDLVASATGVTTAPFSGSVVLCRRAPGSGTQASLQARFMSVGCNANTNNPADPSLNTTLDLNTPAGTTIFANPSTIATGGFYEVFNNSSSGAVITCMQQAASANLKALGVLSVDQGVKTGYDFVAIDGVYPTDATITNGAYNDVVESNLNVSKSLTAGSAKLLLANALVAAAKTLNTQSPAGVYNIAGLPNAIQGVSLPKTMKGTTSGQTCKHEQF